MKRTSQRKVPPGMQEIPYLPGRWIDFSDEEHIAIREADGTLVATDLYISKADYEKVKAKVIELMTAAAKTAK